MEYIPTELLVEILQRLPWTSRRRLRLVSRSWRDLVHDRTTEMQQCRDAVPLVVTTESAYLLLDDLDSQGEEICMPRDLWAGAVGGGRQYKHMEVVGVCNGVLCLCDDAKPGGAITLVNPATGDVLALPPIPRHGLFRRHNSRRSDRGWHQAYSFGFHHGTGQYKVVHVPCFFKTKDTLQVFTLGEASSREVQTPPNRKCKLAAGVISANGVTYWVTEGREEKIVSFDLKSEQVKPTEPLPMAVGPIWYLTEVQRRLSITTCNSNGIQVWILESTAKKEQSWIHQYNFIIYSTLGPLQQLPRPNFMLDKYILIAGGQDQKLFQYQHQPVNYVTRSEAVHSHYCSQRGRVPDIRGHICRAFAYIKTTEALSVYRLW